MMIKQGFRFLGFCVLVCIGIIAIRFIWRGEIFAPTKHPVFVQQQEENEELKKANEKLQLLITQQEINAQEYAKEDQERRRKEQLERERKAKEEAERPETEEERKAREEEEAKKKQEELEAERRNEEYRKKAEAEERKRQRRKRLEEAKERLPKIKEELPEDTKELIKKMYQGVREISKIYLENNQIEVHLNKILSENSGTLYGKYIFSFYDVVIEGDCFVCINGDSCLFNSYASNREEKNEASICNERKGLSGYKEEYAIIRNRWIEYKELSDIIIEFGE